MRASVFRRSLLAGRWRNQQRCLFSTKPTPPQHFDVRQGGALAVNFGSSPRSVIKVVAAWQDFCVVEEAGEGVVVSVDHEAQTLTISIKEEEEGKVEDVERKLRVSVPESFDVFIEANEAKISIQKKLQGDVSIQCTSGSVSVDKIRGMNITFTCGDADLTVKKLLEGNTSVVARSINAKMVNGDEIEMACTTNMSIDAMYGKQVQLQAGEDVRVGLINGNASIHSQRGNIQLSGLDGSFQALAERGNILLQINKLVHHSSSSSSSSGSTAVATAGGITASVDPEMAAVVQCDSLATAGRAVVTIVSDAFEPIGTANTASSVRGKLTGSSGMRSRPLFARSSGEGGGGGSGKINLRGAEAQALHIIGASTRTGEEKDGSKSHEEQEEQADLTLRAHGHIRLETLSWVEALRRKHGFAEGEGCLPPADAGRTASAKKRVPRILKPALD